jgi:hypothetical protein
MRKIWRVKRKRMELSGEDSDVTVQGSVLDVLQAVLDVMVKLMVPFRDKSIESIQCLPMSACIIVTYLYE